MFISISFPHQRFTMDPKKDSLLKRVGMKKMLDGVKIRIISKDIPVHGIFSNNLPLAEKTKILQDLHRRRLVFSYQITLYKLSPLKRKKQNKHIFSTMRDVNLS